MLRVFFAATLLLPLSAQALTKAEQHCMANILFYESNTESTVAQRAVYDVVMNRVKESGKNVCKVMREKNAFSWLDRKKLKPYNAELKHMLREVEGIGQVLINEKYFWFFHKKLKPKWAKKMKCVVIEAHKFCREE